MMMNGENIETMPHQNVVEKLRQLNETADSIKLTVSRQVRFTDLEVQLDKICI